MNVLKNTRRDLAPLARLAFFALAGVRIPVAFDNKAGWKLTADGKSVEMKDGNPIWIDDNGGEAVLNGETITRLNGEAAALRKRAEKAETSLTAFKDIDPETAKKAIETVGKIDAKKLIDSGEVDKVRDQIKTEFTKQIDEVKTENTALKRERDAGRIDNIFAQSDFIRERIAIPRDMLEASLRSNFKVEEGKVIAYDKAGNRMMSKKNIGDPASAEEALELLIDQHPQKETILKAENKQGSGNNGGGGNRGGGRRVTRADYEKLPPLDQAALVAQMGKGEVSIVD